jgi:hypothetical protein
VTTHGSQCCQRSGSRQPMSSQRQPWRMRSVGKAYLERREQQMLCPSIQSYDPRPAGTIFAVVEGKRPRTTRLFSSILWRSGPPLGVAPLAKEKHVLPTISHSETKGSSVLFHGEFWFTVRAHNAAVCQWDKVGYHETMDAKPSRGAVQHNAGGCPAAALHTRDLATWGYAADCGLR